MIKSIFVFSFDFKASHDVIVNNYVSYIYVQSQ
jgi:hypothetical protein